MADTRQQYRGFEARRFGPDRYTIRRQNIYYWRMGGRAWFRYLRHDGTKRVRFVFDHPMSQEKRISQ